MWHIFCNLHYEQKMWSTVPLHTIALFPTCSFILCHCSLPNKIMAVVLHTTFSNPGCHRHAPRGFTPEGRTSHCPVRRARTCDITGLFKD